MATRLDRLACIADRYAWTHVNTFYKWGGDDPSGWDCSGFCIETLKGVGRFPHNGDTTANGLWQKYPKTTNPMRGCLALFGSGGKATHVAWVTDVPSPETVVVLEAGGGGSKTQTVADAIAQNAFVRMRTLGSEGFRMDLMGFVDPFLV